MPRRIQILFIIVVLVSIAVVQLRHESRQRFVVLQVQQAERDALNVEWGKLLLEEGTWSQHRRVEQLARSRLGMNTPDAEDIRLVRLGTETSP